MFQYFDSPEGESMAACSHCGKEFPESECDTQPHGLGLCKAACAYCLHKLPGDAENPGKHIQIQYCDTVSNRVVDDEYEANFIRLWENDTPLVVFSKGRRYSGARRWRIEEGKEYFHWSARACRAENLEWFLERFLENQEPGMVDFCYA